MSLFLKVCGFLGLVSLAAFVASFLTFRDKKKTVVILYGGGLEAALMCDVWHFRRELKPFPSPCGKVGWGLSDPNPPTLV